MKSEIYASIHSVLLELMDNPNSNMNEAIHKINDLYSLPVEEVKESVPLPVSPTEEYTKSLEEEVKFHCLENEKLKKELAFEKDLTSEYAKKADHYRSITPSERKTSERVVKKNSVEEIMNRKNVQGVYDVWDIIKTKDGRIVQITHDDMQGLNYEDIERHATEDEIENDSIDNFRNRTSSSPMEKQISEITDEDKGLGRCVEKNCTKFAVRDYNGCKHYVCQGHYDSLTSFFEDEYK